jgi:hypothetical protein
MNVAGHVLHNITDSFLNKKLQYGELAHEFHLILNIPKLLIHAINLSYLKSARQDLKRSTFAVQTPDVGATLAPINVAI